MPQDGLVRHPDVTAGELFRSRYLPVREIEHLSIAKLKWCRKIDRQVVSQLVLRKRGTVAISDLATRSRDIQDVSARELLRLESGNDRPLHQTGRWFWRRRHRGRYLLRNSLYRKQGRCGESDALCSQTTAGNTEAAHPKQLMALQKPMDVLGEFAPDAFG